MIRLIRERVENGGACQQNGPTHKKAPLTKKQNPKGKHFFNGTGGIFLGERPSCNFNPHSLRWETAREGNPTTWTSLKQEKRKLLANGQVFRKKKVGETFRPQTEKLTQYKKRSITRQSSKSHSKGVHKPFGANIQGIQTQ